MVFSTMIRSLTKARFVHERGRGLWSLFLFCLVPVGLAQSREAEHPKPELGPLTIQPQTPLPEIASGELTSNGAGLALPMDNGFLADEGVNLQVEREVHSLWRLRLAEEADLYNLVIDYDLVSIDGEADRLSMPTGQDSNIDVRLRAIPPVVVERDRTGVTVEGGVRMELDIRAVRLSGIYRGRLTVTINHL